MKRSRVLCMLPAAEGVYPDDAVKRRVETVKSYETDDLTIDIGYMPALSGFNPFGGRSGPYELAVADFLSAERARQAEDEGYDAFIPFGMLDIGVELARYRVAIPVIGQSQSAYTIAGMMVDRCAAIWYQSRSFAYGWRQVARYKADTIVKEFYAVEMPNSEMPSRRDELRERFIEVSKTAVARGAQLIICSGMSMCPVEFSADELAADIGVPVLEGMGAAVGVARMWLSLGVSYSPLRYPRAHAQEVPAMFDATTLRREHGGVGSERK